MLRLGILSTARIADAIVGGARDSLNCQIAAVASRDPARAREWAAQRGIPRVFDSYAELIASDEIDAVYVPLPNSLHAEWTIRAAGQGKHVLCEKPLACTAAECEAMRDAATAHGVKLMEAFMYRFHPQTRRVQEMVAAGELGEVMFVRAAFDITLNRPQDIRWSKELGGGAMLDLGCYCIDGIASLLSEPAEVVSAVGRFTPAGVDETMAGVLAFPGGRYASFDCSYVLPFQQQLQVLGSAGKLTVMRPWTIPANQDAQIRFERQGQTEMITLPGTNQYRLMLEHFAACVLEDRPVELDPAASQANMLLLDAVFESARTRHQVAPGGAV